MRRSKNRYRSGNGGSDKRKNKNRRGSDKRVDKGKVQRSECCKSGLLPLYQRLLVLLMEDVHLIHKTKDVRQD